MLIILALGRLRQKNQKFKTNLGYTARAYLKIKKKKKKRTMEVSLLLIARTLGSADNCPLAVEHRTICGT
jgi:hypothetical protein